jgi:hypothetical protein
MQALAAFCMRYVLTLLMALVLLRILFIAASQWRRVRRSADFAAPRIGKLTDAEGREYGLDHDNILGRSRRCDIVIPDPTVAGVHAQIYQRRKTVYLQPLARDRVYLNGEPVSRRAKLRSGDVVGMGDAALIVSLYFL